MHRRGHTFFLDGSVAPAFSTEVALGGGVIFGAWEGDGRGWPQRRMKLGAWSSCRRC
eukprot:CAMPEP_0206439080 /NCGR_PEP_ID=MMETSP0324_2-20121206/12004_1 /ASSEMBLY_ACC=CAM_ASM_000836 /TAXON_ID=2866 /ORGANISM="Crypthecodinium cohnii, Strain Seligo" /LENGTH=56 /DNA_ID=CAMNT_0053906645 /DNA_START=115 /DNA_END=282 /DNA_ORIENTATION=-